MSTIVYGREEKGEERGVRQSGLEGNRLDRTPASSIGLGCVSALAPEMRVALMHIICILFGNEVLLAGWGGAAPVGCK